jgi:hypothetical protein
MITPLNREAVTLTGKSGEQYTFGIWLRQTVFNAKGGVYVMARSLDGIRKDFVAVYVGETGDMSKRPFAADRIPCFNQHGVDHIFTLDEQNAARRRAIVDDLVQAMSPVCNRI